MKTPAELAARLRKMVLAAQHHYSPTGEPLRSIVVTPEWLEDMADAANALDADPVAWIEHSAGGVAYSPLPAARDLPDGVRFDLYALLPEQWRGSASAELPSAVGINKI